MIRSGANDPPVIDNNVPLGMATDGAMKHTTTDDSMVLIHSVLDGSA